LVLECPPSCPGVGSPASPSNKSSRYALGALSFAPYPWVKLSVLELAMCLLSRSAEKAGLSGGLGPMLLALLYPADCGPRLDREIDGPWPTGTCPAPPAGAEAPDA
jgi:hypothetical protein